MHEHNRREAFAERAAETHEPAQLPSTIDDLGRDQDEQDDANEASGPLAGLSSKGQTGQRAEYQRKQCADDRYLNGDLH